MLVPAFRVHTIDMTRRPAFRLLVWASGIVLVLYGAAIGYMVSRETALVFVSAGERPVTRARSLLPAAGTIPWDSLRVPAADSVPVFVLESRVDSAPLRPWVIYFHGNAGLVGSRGNVGRYQLLRESGFNVLAVEYRGYGVSSAAGMPSEAGVHADARAAWEHLTRTRGVAPERIVVYGWSLGSGPATKLASETRPAALITEGGFTSLPAVGAELYPWLPVGLIMRTRFDNLARASSVASPWLILHGRQDEEIPFSHGEALSAAAPRARLVTLAAGHDDGVLGDRATALAALRQQAEALMATSK